MIKDIIKYNEKDYQLSLAYLENMDLFEIMIFPIEDGVVSGNEVYCYRPEDYEFSNFIYKEIKTHPEKYLSDKAIKEYLANEECNEGCDTYDMNLNLDIINLLNEYVNEIAKTRWCNDECPPRFVVSICGDGEHQKILLTVSHLGSSFSEVIFPKPDATYGYESIEQ